MKKTKIVCTLGPSSDTKEIISAMAEAGMNVVRLNFSHGTHADHAKKIQTVKEVRNEKKIPLPIMLDTKGPEFRIKTFKNGKVSLKEGSTFRFTSEDVIGDENRVGVSYSDLAKEMRPGDKILLNNGLMVFRVKETSATDVICNVEVGGELSNRKSMFFPDKELHLTFLSEQDKEDLLFGIEQGVDFVALSFVSKAQDVLDVRNFLNEHGGNHIDIIAKIENRAGVKHLEEIMKVSDGIMVARGDLGVEIPYEELPDIQKSMISNCRIYGKRVITATEMLESMIHNARPTRAEISDVANAVYDGTSAIMLSGETAAGKYPVLTVKTMARIAEHTEKNIHYAKRFAKSEFKIKNTVDAISHATCSMAMDIGAKAIVVCTLSGMTARMVSRFRSPVDILAIATNERTYRKLALSWGVTPIICEEFNSTEVLFYTAKKLAEQTMKLEQGDLIVITGGLTNGVSGNTNIIKVETI